MWQYIGVDNRSTKFQRKEVNAMSKKSKKKKSLSTEKKIELLIVAAGAVAAVLKAAADFLEQINQFFN